MRARGRPALLLLLGLAAATGAAEPTAAADRRLLIQALEKPLAAIQGRLPAFTATFRARLGEEGAAELGQVRLVAAEGGRLAIVLDSPLLRGELVRDARATRLVVPAKEVALVGKGPLPADSPLAPDVLFQAMVSQWPRAHSVADILRIADAGAVAILLQQFLKLERDRGAGGDGPVFRAGKEISDGTLTLELEPGGRGIRGLGWRRGPMVAHVAIAIREGGELPPADLDGLRVVEVPRDELEHALGRALARTVGILYYNERRPAPRDRTRAEGAGRLVVDDGRRVAFLYGSPYQVGFQHGKLLAREARRLCDAVLCVAGLAYSVEEGEWFLDTLRGAWARLQPHIPGDYLEEMRGLAEGSGIPLERVQLANVFPALFHCSGFALFGRATADGALYHGRVLDYVTELGLQRDAVVFVVKKRGAIAFANVGYAGFVGSVSGMNARAVAIGEMGGGGVGLWDGTPMPILVRMGLERAASLDDACTLFREARRTCEYYYVISDGRQPTAVAVAATPQKIEFLPPGQAHPRLPVAIEDGVVMSAGDRYRALVERIQGRHGHIDARAARRLMTRPVATESNLHNVLFVPERLTFYVANARGREPAYSQPYARYDLKALLATLAEPPEGDE
ncbi:MAG: C45 family autoproteolytic acyltransferase/hydrolase [Candidatus Brocadiia bacterium]